MLEDADQNFEINEIVWAKVLGYPWWPAQIAQIINMNGKSGQYCSYRVNFLGDTSHADLRFDKIKKWNQKIVYTESKKLKESIQLANNLLQGIEKKAIINLKDLQDHQLKDLTIKLNDQVFSQSSLNDILVTLKNISNNEILTIVKLNLGQQYLTLYQNLQGNKQENHLKQTQQFVDSLQSIIGYKQQQEFQNLQLYKNEKPTPNSDDTNEITDSPIKKAKIQEISKDTLCNQN